MALHTDFPKSPFEIIDPEYRWFPADEALREKTYEKLLPPLVVNLRREVKKWRDSGYDGATETSKALLRWWFQREHLINKPDEVSNKFQYYFAQRESVETVIYLTDVVGVKDKYDLLRYDASGLVSASMFPEDWKRLVIKMATGTGKTKVISLLLAWSYFHKTYEENSTLARNFLIIAPNIIVLDRLRADFDGLKIFHQDPIIPDNGFEGQNWQDDFQCTLHIQDNVGIIQKTGNIFLTNIHRVYEGNNTEPSFDDEDTRSYFLGKKPTGATQESKVNLSDIVRDVGELVVFNDEAHHIHDERMAWFKSIQDIHNNLKMRGSELSLQIDTTATPRHNNGAIFVQTIADYPLVEAIYQNIVKHPVLPDSASRARLVERKSSKFTEKYEDYIHLGYLEWEKAYKENGKAGKKAILFVMTDDTKNCDLVAEYLENRYPNLKDKVLVIHTKRNGEISEATTGKAQEELEGLRKAANEIDSDESRYKAVVSVMMLKEGWDVRNVTTIVGLRAYTAAANILPEQTLGRGLRRMYWGEDIAEPLSVIGTDAFMDFVESIKIEGVEIEYKNMSERTPPNAPMVIEIDNENTKKDIDKLDIQIPVLTPRIYREYKNLSQLDFSNFNFKTIDYQQFSAEEQREIVFREITSGEVSHITKLDTSTPPNYQSVIGFFTQAIMKELRLFSGYDILFGKVKEFVEIHLFGEGVELESMNTLRNLSELEATKTIIETFKKEINDLTVLDKGEAVIKDYIKISKVRPFVVKDQPCLLPQKSVFNKVIGDSHFELEFASFLDKCDDIVSYVKNYMAVHFKIDYQNANGDIRDYYPDFIVKRNHKEIYILETKGQVDLDVPLKLERLKQWCDDINKTQTQFKYSSLYIEQEKFNRYNPNDFATLVKAFISEEARNA
ncbi:DEAD/DEAH box helicase family protein [Patescibacteria group bacterium]|nr:DEAD/DEAH box helicase family protein [Patescibacteria group bacterium]